MALTAHKELRVLLVSNYPIDRQQSMQRFAQMMASGLRARGHEAKTVFPRPLLGRISLFGPTVAKWLAYIDKFIIFPPVLSGEARHADITHICDHSNSLYVSAIKERPHLITCHDLLAVRAGLGEETFVDLNPTGRLLQRLILKGLRAARTIVCDSAATRADAERLVYKQSIHGKDDNRIRLVLLGLNRDLRILSPQEVDLRLAAVTGLNSSLPFLLHVGSSLKRKNRAGLLRIFREIKDIFPGQLVFCGAPIPDHLRNFARESAVSERVIEVVNPEDDTVEALYNRAFALVYPSFSEGFGWPILEAQACGCPVICSNTSSCPEAAGGAALLRDPHDEAGFASDILALMDENERQRLVRLGLENLQRFSSQKTVEQYEQIYYEVLESYMGGSL